MTKFKELLEYLKCIKDENQKNNHFLNGLQYLYKNQTHKPQTLDEAIQKEKYCEDQAISKVSIRVRRIERRKRGIEMGKDLN